MNIANRELNIGVEWEKAQEALQAARVLLAQHLPTSAISRAYYAAFHAGKALLLSEGLEIKSHQALGRLFSLHFVKTKRFEVRFARIVSMAQKYREEADYTAEAIFTDADATQCLRDVQEWVDAVAVYLQRSGLLQP